MELIRSDGDPDAKTIATDLFRLLGGNDAAREAMTEALRRDGANKSDHFL